MDHNKVIVGMSGGVDSAVAAYLLKEQGYNVIGLSLRLYDYSDDQTCETSHHRPCCSPEDIKDARFVAGLLDIPFYVLDYRDAFRDEIIRYFIDSYREGKTPNPCIRCNRKIKFHYLLDYADKLGAYYIATGHYVRRDDAVPGRTRLLMGVDEKKDQSYYLAQLTQATLKRSLFPLGTYKKEEVRAIAKKANLIVAKKADSQEICFVTDEGHGIFIEKQTGEKATSGNIVDACGKILGRHTGLYNYTIGQRKGLGISRPSPLHVIHIDSNRNEIVVGDKKQAYRNECIVKDVTFLDESLSKARMHVDVRIRSSHKPAHAEIQSIDTTVYKIVFDEPQYAITPGQTAAFYSGDELIGGGTIE